MPAQRQSQVKSHEGRAIAHQWADLRDGDRRLETAELRSPTDL